MIKEKTYIFYKRINSLWSIDENCLKIFKTFTSVGVIEEFLKYKAFLYINNQVFIELPTSFKDFMLVDFNIPLKSLPLDLELNDINLVLSYKKQLRFIRCDKKITNDFKPVDFKNHDIHLKHNNSKYISLELPKDSQGRIALKTKADESVNIGFNQQTHKIYNIPRDDISSIDMLSAKYVKLILNDEIRFTSEQKEFNKKYKVKSEVINKSKLFYSVNEVENPKKILITFPGIMSLNNKFYTLSALNSCRSMLKDTKIIAFLDANFVYGNYLTFNQDKQPYRNDIKTFIDSHLNKYQLSERDLFFYGNSKGGSIAVDYIDLYPNAYFFIDIPQLNLEKYKPNPLQRFIIDNYFPKYVNYENKLQRMENSNVYYVMAENDIESNCGLDIDRFLGINAFVAKGTTHSGGAQKILPFTLKNMINHMQRQHKTHQDICNEVFHEYNLSICMNTFAKNKD